jgi:hypothetical protein
MLEEVAAAHTALLVAGKTATHETNKTKQNKTTHTKMRRPSLNLLSFLSSPIPAGAGAAAVAAAACVTCVTAAAGSSLHVVAPGPGLGPSLLRETNPSAEAIA